MFKKKINQYYCKLDKKFKPKFTKVVHTKHDGSMPGQIMIQYQFDINKKMLTLTVACEPKNCNSMQKTGEYIILSEPSESSKNYFNLYNWVENTKDEIRKYSDREIIIHKKGSSIPLNELLKNSSKIF